MIHEALRRSWWDSEKYEKNELFLLKFSKKVGYYFLKNFIVRIFKNVLHNFKRFKSFLSTVQFVIDVESVTYFHLFFSNKFETSGKGMKLYILENQFSWETIYSKLPEKFSLKFGWVWCFFNKINQICHKQGFIRAWTFEFELASIASDSSAFTSGPRW